MSCTICDEDAAIYIEANDPETYREALAVACFAEGYAEATLKLKAILCDEHERAIRERLTLRGVDFRKAATPLDDPTLDDARRAYASKIGAFAKTQSDKRREEALAFARLHGNTPAENVVIVHTTTSDTERPPEDFARDTYADLKSQAAKAMQARAVDVVKAVAQDDNKAFDDARALEDDDDGEALS